MPFQVRDAQIADTKVVLGLAESEVDFAFDALQALPISRNLPRLASIFHDTSGLDRASSVALFSIVGALVRMYVETNYQSDGVINAFGEALVNQPMLNDFLPEHTSATDCFKLKLKSVLVQNSPLAITFTLNSLANFDGRLFLGATLVTDMRPIFVSGSSLPETKHAILIHRLQITYQDDTGEERRFFLCLDSSDLAPLAGMLTNGIAEASLLTSLVEPSRISVIPT